MSEKKNWTVTMRCVVDKIVDLDGCTEQEARDRPWDFAVNEYETDMQDWEITHIEESE